ncbi:MAG: hypothetical protein ACR5K5_01670 [Wolbachia sp.]
MSDNQISSSFILEFRIGFKHFYMGMLVIREYNIELCTVKASDKLICEIVVKLFPINPALSPESWLNIDHSRFLI